jgi:signal transduction histidine kinase
MMEKLYQNGRWTWEGVHVTKDGQRIPVEISNRLFDFRGTKGILATVRDISVAKRAEEEKEMLRSQLNQAQKLESVGRLAGGVAHDFNNMLGVILGHAEIAMDKIDQTHNLYSDLNEIRKAANRSADLTRQLLAFARRQTISPRVLDLNATVEGMTKMLRRLIGEDIDLVWRPGTNLSPVKVDPGQIDQILANLCVNARDAISGTGKVTIETGTTTFDRDYCANHPDFLPGRFVMLAVSDNGCGMVKEIREKIFEPFYTTKGIGKGTGLGLSTVYGIVKQNHGFINVYSEPGNGTTFKIYLPPAEEQATENPAAPLEKNLRGKETVLLVEDEAPILALVESVLEHYGYQVLAAKSPKEALKMVQDHPGPIHLIITDVVMPEMNGKDLRDKLAKFRPQVRIIFMSGYTANVIAHHGILDENIDFLQKPFSIKTLLQMVRSVLDR